MNKESSQQRSLTRQKLSDTDADRHTKLGNEVESTTLKTSLNGLTRKGTSSALTTKERLEAKDTGFSERTTMIAGLLLPTLASDAANTAQVLVTLQRGLSRVAMLPNVRRAPRRNDHLSDTMLMTGLVE